MQLFTLSRFSRIGNMPSGEISYLVPGARRFGLSRFSIPGTLQSRHMAVEGAEGTIAATRDSSRRRRSPCRGRGPGRGAGRTGIPGRSSVVPGSWDAAVRAVPVLHPRHPTIPRRRRRRSGCCARRRTGDSRRCGSGGGNRRSRRISGARSYAVPDVSGGVNITFEEV